MTILELLAKLTGLSAGKLVAALEAAAAASPDLAPAIAEWLVKLNNAVGGPNLVAVAADIFREAGDIAKGDINPKSHPSDAV